MMPMFVFARELYLLRTELLLFLRNSID